MMDLDALERRHARAVSTSTGDNFAWSKWLQTIVSADSEMRARQHGLFSKARRMLDIAGWSETAQKDIEIFRLVDCDGLTPLLALFNEASLGKGAEAIEAVRKEQEQLAAEQRLRIAHQR